MGQDVERGQGSRSYSVIRGQPGLGFSESKEREVGGKGRDEISFVNRRVTVPEGTRESAGREKRQRSTMQPAQSYGVGGQRSSWQLTGKPTGAWPVYRGRWCAEDTLADHMMDK
ncbi:UNVERIFIED_CONTAM: hypothetical protein FKN15_057336 [Acipenser sinensis]